MQHESYYEHVFENFLLIHSYHIDQIEFWYPSGRSEITVKMFDGSYNIFYDAGWYTRYVPPREDPDMPLTNEEWLRWFSIRLGDRLSERYMTQSELAQRVGVSTNTINRYLKRKSMPTAYVFNRIAEVLECDITDFTFKDHLD